MITLGASGLDARKAGEHDVEHPAATRSLRNTPQLAKELGHFVALEEHAAGVPVLADAPVDLRVIFVAVKGHSLGLELDEDTAQRAHADVELLREGRLRPGAALEEGLVDACDGLGLAAATHGASIRSSGTKARIARVPRRVQRRVYSPRLGNTHGRARGGTPRATQARAAMQKAPK